MKVVYLTQCIHVFDTMQEKFVKLNAKNLHTALKSKDSNLTRQQLLKIILANPDKFEP